LDLLQKAGIGSKNGKELMADGMSWNLDWEPGNSKEVPQTFVSVVNNIYLWRKVVCFVCSEIHGTGMLQMVFLVSLESSWQGRGPWAWFHGIWTCSAKVLEYWMISSL
jgi:hypothetical protein